MARSPRARISSLTCSNLTALAVATFLMAGPAIGQNEPIWPVRNKLVGAGGDKAEDVSGIACEPGTFPRSCLIIDDETRGAQIVIVREGEITAGETIALIDNAFNGEPLELDGEGVAFDGGHFYVVGSHGHPRDKNMKLDPFKDAEKIAAKIKTSSQIVKIRVNITPEGKASEPPTIQLSSKFRDVLAGQPELKPFFDKRLDANGLTIEGLAVRDGRLFAGLRAPVLNDGKAVVVSAALDALFGNEDANARLHRVDCGSGRGIRDLVAFETGFLVLLGPSGNEDGTYSICFWDGGDRGKLLKDLPDYKGKKGKQLKAEAFVPLDRNAEGVRVLMLFDGAKEGGPRPIRLHFP